MKMSPVDNAAATKHNTQNASRFTYAYNKIVQSHHSFAADRSDLFILVYSFIECQHQQTVDSV